MRGLCAQLPSIGDLAVERGQDFGVVDRPGLYGIAIAQPLFGGAARERLNDQRLLSGLARLAHLFERQVEDEVGRHNALPRIMAHPLGLRVDLPGKGAHPHQIGVGIASTRDLVLGAEEVGDRLIRAR